MSVGVFLCCRPCEEYPVMTLPQTFHRRTWWRGALSFPASLGAISVASAEYWPDWPLLGPIARMTESAAPQLAVLTVLLGMGIVALGGRRFGAALTLVAVLGLAGVIWRHVERSAPLEPEASPVVHVLWYNMLHTNPVPPGDLVAALDASAADVILLTEATPLKTMRAQIAERFATVLGCAGRRCDVMILVRDPAIQAELVPMPSTGTDRMGVVQIALPDGQTLRLVAAHLLKPWYYGLSASDQWMVTHQAASAEGPVVIVGDFNAAPWSKRLRETADLCGLKTERVPVPTWPAAAGRWGIPIDLILTRGGAVLRQVTPWGGDELGSNHRGLSFEIGYDPTRAEALPADCHVPQEMRDRMGLPHAPLDMSSCARVSCKDSSP